MSVHDLASSSGLDRNVAADAAMSRKIPKRPAEKRNCLTPQQESAIELLLTGSTSTAAAEALGISRRTIYRWRRHDQRFRRRLDARRRELYQQAEDRFRALLDPALDQIEERLRDPYTPTAFRAARAVVTLAALGKSVATRRRKVKRRKSGDTL